MSSSKTKSREPLTTRQRSILINFYNQNPYPSASERHLLAQITGRTIKQIQDWFSNRRRNDHRLISTTVTNNLSLPLPPPPSQPMPIHPVYYSSPPAYPICPCCFPVQLPSTDHHPMIYYPPLNSFH